MTFSSFRGSPIERGILAVPGQILLAGGADVLDEELGPLRTGVIHVGASRAAGAVDAVQLEGRAPGSSRAPPGRSGARGLDVWVKRQVVVDELAEEREAGRQVRVVRAPGGSHCGGGGSRASMGRRPSRVRAGRPAPPCVGQGTERAREEPAEPPLPLGIRLRRHVVTQKKLAVVDHSIPPCWILAARRSSPIAASPGHCPPTRPSRGDPEWRLGIAGEARQ